MALNKAVIPGVLRYVRTYPHVVLGPFATNVVDKETGEPRLAEALLRLVDEADRKDIATLFQYGENTVGALMTTDYAWLRTITTLLRGKRDIARRLVIEITESAVMADDGMSIQRLNALRDLGVSLAIDDFGTGYSSLGLLRRLPVDTLKIDKLFVDRIADDATAAAFLEREQRGLALALAGIAVFGVLVAGAGPPGSWLRAIPPLDRMRYPEKALAAKAKEALVLELLREARLSQGQAARLLDLSRPEVLELMAQHQIPSGPESPGELEQEVEYLRRLVQPNRARDGR